MSPVILGQRFMDLLLGQGSSAELRLREGQWSGSGTLFHHGSLVSGGRLPPPASVFLHSVSGSGRLSWPRSAARHLPVLYGGPGGGQGALARLHSVDSSSLKILAAIRCRLQNPPPRCCMDMKNSHRKITPQTRRQISEGNVVKGSLGRTIACGCCSCISSTGL